MPSDPFPVAPELSGPPDRPAPHPRDPFRRPAPPRRLPRRRRPLRPAAARRRTIAAWLAVAAAATLAATSVSAAVEEAHDTVTRLGPTRVAYRTVAALPPGHVLAGTDLEAVAVPVDLLPEGAVGGPPDGRVTRAAVGRREVLVEPRLSPAGVSPEQALLAAGRRAVTVPGRHQRIPARPGDGADLVGVTTVEGRASVVARDAVVLAVDDEGDVTLSIAPDDLAATAAAIATGVVVVAVHPNG